MSRKWRDQIPVLNEYQYTSDPNFKNFPLGTEYSHDYSHDKEIYLVVADSATEVAVSFKSFIKDFNISFKFETSDEKITQGNLETVKSIGVTYTVGLDIPAISVDDARVNAARLDAIMIMLDPLLNQKGGSKKKIKSLKDGAIKADQKTGRETENLKDEPKLVLLSNLINNGKYTNKKIVRNFEDLKKYALPGYITKFDFKANLEMGFFEYDNKMWPKVFETSITFLAKMTVDKKKYALPFNTDGSISSNEFTSGGSWPFGVNTK